MFVGISWNCAAELKFLITALLVVCSVATVLQFLPARFSLSPSDLRSCVNDVSSRSTLGVPTNSTHPIFAASDVENPDGVSPYSEVGSPTRENDEILEGGIIKRRFNPIDAVAYNFILTSAYRGGLNTFAIMGLASKPLHVFGKPTYQCEWVPNNSTFAVTSLVAILESQI